MARELGDAEAIFRFLSSSFRLKPSTTVSNCATSSPATSIDSLLSPSSHHVRMSSAQLNLISTAAAKALISQMIASSSIFSTSTMS